MSVEQNKEIVRRFYEEVWNKGNGQAAAEIVGENPEGRFDHGTTGPLSAESQAQIAEGFRNMFSDFQVTLEQIVAEGDMVAVRWRMSGLHKASGKPMADYTGQNMWRLSDGKMIEVRNNRDDLGLFQQLGVVPSTEELWSRLGGENYRYVSDSKNFSSSAGGEG